MFHVMAGQKTRQQTANDRRQEPPEEGPNNYDQITFYAFHSFLVEIQTKLETYVPFMSNTNLEIYKAARLYFMGQVPFTVPFLFLSHSV